MEEQVKSLRSSTLSLRVEDLLLIVKALDVYAYSLYASSSLDELNEVQHLVRTIIRKIPPRELDS